MGFSGDVQRFTERHLLLGRCVRDPHAAPYAIAGGTPNQRHAVMDLGKRVPSGEESLSPRSSVGSVLTSAVALSGMGLIVGHWGIDSCSAGTCHHFTLDYWRSDGGVRSSGWVPSTKWVAQQWWESVSRSCGPVDLS